MRIAADLGRPDVSIDAAALEALHGYAWPGNVRELRNVLERAVLLCEARTVTRRDLRFATSGSEPVAAASGASDLALTLEQVEKRHIELVLKDERGHIDSAARRLDVPRSTLYKRLRALGILVPRT
jgi:DNA-binding NtrC family response regulator